MTPSQADAALELVRRALLERIRYESWCRIMGVPISYYFADGFRPWRDGEP